ncbi:MAG: hypothetical protein HZC41_22525 [Chloroflexi bacterium]|nr:hypothetical protein [Chloroflexota bacterium]
MLCRTLLVLLVIMLISSPAAAQPTIGGCPVFPVDNAWNTDISTALVHPNSGNYIANINANGGDFVHPDFGEDPTYGIPWITVPGAQPKVPVTFDYADESDPGPYPIPPNAPVESGGDRHIIVVDADNCILYETWASTYVGGTAKAWTAGSGAIFNLDSNALRPDGWTSADAAGLPILPGLARCEEANSGQISHALRFTVNRTQRAYIYPARHFASSITDPNYPPMGLRLRLKASYDLSGFSGQALAIAQALKQYGMILADNGSNWFISGETNPTCWDDNNLNRLKSIPGTAFEVIQSPPPAEVTLATPTLYLPTDGQAISTTRPVIGWNTVTGAASYDVELGREGQSADTINVPAFGLTEYVPLNPLLPGYIYVRRVRGKDGSDNPTPWSETRRFTVASSSAAAPLRNVFTTPHPVLTWNRITWATRYAIEISGGTLPAPIQDTTGALSYSPSIALGNGVYMWRVRAQDALNRWGGWSAPETFVVDG